MKSRNIVLFSSGISEKNGILRALSESLGRKGYECSYWRDLFQNARDPGNIALLPILIKKIPTFDYAILVCEGHDVTTMLRGEKREQVNTMRDNVLFEIGLCVMALGLSRTILITDEDVRLPDDLTGTNNETALKRIVYHKDDRQSYELAGSDLTTYIHEMELASGKIDDYIKRTGNDLTPVVIGAASSTACGYVSNFIFRTLEHINDGIFTDENQPLLHYPYDKIHVHIVLPELFDEFTSERARKLMSTYEKGSVPNARNRQAEFRYEIRGDELHIIDFPTSIVTSYDTARMILNIDADDTLDTHAEKRFTAKELNLFEATVKALLKSDYLKQVIDEHYSTMPEDERLSMISRVSDIVNYRLYIEHMSY